MVRISLLKAFSAEIVLNNSTTCKNLTFYTSELTVFIASINIRRCILTSLHGAANNVATDKNKKTWLTKLFSITLLGKNELQAFHDLIKCSCIKAKKKEGKHFESTKNIKPNKKKKKESERRQNENDPVHYNSYMSCPLYSILKS